MEVEWPDQQKINEFSKLNTRLTKLENQDRILKQRKEDLEDLSMEIELVDEDEELMYTVGEAFVYLKQSDVMARIEADSSKLDEELEQKSSEKAEITEKMEELKTALYAKFGRNNINLERD